MNNTDSLDKLLQETDKMISEEWENLENFQFESIDDVSTVVTSDDVMLDTLKDFITWACDNDKINFLNVYDEKYESSTAMFIKINDIIFHCDQNRKIMNISSSKNSRLYREFSLSRDEIRELYEWFSKNIFPIVRERNRMNHIKYLTSIMNG